MIMDIYSRKIIAAEVFSSETGEHAAELLQRAVWNEKGSSHNICYCNHALKSDEIQLWFVTLMRVKSMLYVCNTER